MHHHLKPKRYSYTTNPVDFIINLQLSKIIQATNAIKRLMMNPKSAAKAKDDGGKERKRTTRKSYL